MESLQLGLFGDHPDQGAASYVKVESKKPKADDKRLRFWAVIQINCVDENYPNGSDPCVWGIGETRDLAIKDTLQSFGYYGPTGKMDMDDLLEDIESGKYNVVRCSRRLFKEVEQWGGELDFKIFPDVGIFSTEDATK